MARKNKHKGGGNPNRPRFWGRHAVAAALDNPDRKVLKAWATQDAADFMNFPKEVLVVRAEAPDLGRMEDGLARAYADAGLPRGSECAIVIDGLDELAGDQRVGLIDEARVLAYGAGHRIFLTTRPVAGAMTEAVLIPPMTEQSALALITGAFAVDLGDHFLERLSPTIREAISRPLFALLLGRHVARTAGSIDRPAQLVAELVRAALDTEGSDEDAQTSVLKRVALLSLDESGRPVPKGAIGSSAEVRRALESRLVTDAGDAVTFPLALLREWFGAQSLGDPAVAQEIARSPERRQRWRETAITAAAILPHDAAHDLLDALARAAPAYAGEVLVGAQASWLGDSTSSLPGPEVLGVLLRRSFDALTAGLGPLNHLIGPRGPSGLPALGIAMRANYVRVAWPTNSGAHDAVTVLRGEDEHGRFPGWSWRLNAAAAAAPLWPWARAQDELRRDLTNAIRQRGLLADSSAAGKEIAWDAAIALEKRGRMSSRPIEVAALQAKLANLPGDLLRLRPNGPLIPIGVLHRYLDRHPELDLLVPPYPSPDIAPATNWVWDGYSDKQLLARTTAVYGAAIEIYESLVSQLFTTFAAELRLAQLLPVRLVGRLRPMHGTDMSGAPSLSTFFEALPDGSKSRVEISIGTEPWTWEEIQQAVAASRSRRPHADRWLQVVRSEEHLEVFGSDPATRIAYEWLVEDLAPSGWVDSGARSLWT